LRRIVELVADLIHGRGLLGFAKQIAFLRYRLNGGKERGEGVWLGEYSELVSDRIAMF